MILQPNIFNLFYLFYFFPFQFISFYLFLFSELSNSDGVLCQWGDDFSTEYFSFVYLFVYFLFLFNSLILFLFFLFKNSASGIAGPTEYYVNGAMILRPNIPAGNSLIHVIDRVLDPPSDKSLLAYLRDGPE
jgi:hypothetical protein